MCAGGKKSFLWACAFTGLLLAACNTALFFPGGGGQIDDFLPSALTLDISELPADYAADAKAINSALTQDEVYDRTIRAGAAVVHGFHRIADKALALGAAIKDDMTSPDQTQVEGTLNIRGTSVAYLADFSAFDIDGDGTPDGSGRADQDPVALRIWTDNNTGLGYQRFLCALITTRPSSANLGAGSMYTKPYAADASIFQDFAFHIDWDRTDASHKWNEVYVTGHARVDLATDAGHHRVDVRTNSEGGIEKTVRSTSIFTDNPWGFENYAFAGVYQVGGSDVLLSGETTGGIIQVSFENQCISIEDYTGSPAQGCAGLDTQDMTLLDAPIGGETNFPAGFPEEPTFGG